MASGPPRPKQNSEGGKKKPSANPDGGGKPPEAAPAQGAPMGPPNTAPPMGPTPGQQQVMGTAQQLQGAPGIPNTPGAGVPDGLQSFPQDAAALMQLMKQGYAPGADNMMHAQAQNAHAIARAQEAAAQSQAMDSMQKQQDAQALGALLQRLMMQGALPHPADVAMQTAGPPQLQSGLTAAPPSGPPSMPPGPAGPGQGQLPPPQ